MVVAGAAMLVTVFVLPIGGRQIGPPVSFMPAVLSVVACFDIMSAYLLVGDYRARGDPRLLVMACATTSTSPGTAGPHPAGGRLGSLARPLVTSDDGLRVSVTVFAPATTPETVDTRRGTACYEIPQAVLGLIFVQGGPFGVGTYRLNGRV